MYERIKTMRVKSQSMQVHIIQTESNISNRMLIIMRKCLLQMHRRKTNTDELWKAIKHQFQLTSTLAKVKLFLHLKYAQGCDREGARTSGRGKRKGMVSEFQCITDLN